MSVIESEAGRVVLSAPPEVRLAAAFPRPFENAVATARTCYSGRGIVTEAEVSGDGLEGEKRAARAARRDRLAADIYRAGHHTTLQHAHFQFALSNVSRHFLWAFLHSHPFYNSEQVSQRYVEVKPGTVYVPALPEPALSAYTETIDALFSAYREIDAALSGPVGEAYWSVFPARRSHPDRWSGAIRKRTQELARYVLPVATFAYLYHTVSGLTLLRYWRTAQFGDCPAEQKLVVGKMVEALLRHDPLYGAILEDPIAREEDPSVRAALPRTPEGNTAFRDRFDLALGGRVSKLVDWKPNAEAIVAEAVREVLGAGPEALSDDRAIELVVDPAENRLLSESLNLQPHDQISRALVHASYTFRKRLSHTADSQDQRHRMTPASRPHFASAVSDSPDAIVPPLVAAHPPALRIFERAMEIAWNGARRVLAGGGSRELAAYLLPNATAIRFTESADFPALRHKLAMRLCWNAQEEIWRASVDEAEQVRALHPRLGKWLLPPCGVRARAKAKPICPEGERFCGVPAWRLAPEDWARAL